MSATHTTQDPNCVFCKIVAGQIPGHKLYEDDHVLAFLDVGPLARGHALVIPKTHYARLDEMDGELAAACAGVLPDLARALRAALELPPDWAFNVLQNNGRAAHQAVDHVHFHLIPKTDTGGLGIDWPAGELHAEDAKRLAERVRNNLPSGS